MYAIHPQRKIILTLAKVIRKTLLKATATGVMTIAVGRETVLDSEHSKDSRGFIANEQSEGVSGCKSTKRVGRFLLNWPNRSLAKGRPRARHQR